MTEPLTQQGVIIIQGVTRDGRKFRPSDWAERMSGMLSTFGKDHRIHYSPLLKPISFGGAKSVALHCSLLETHPGIYNQLIDFARRNELVVVDESGKEIEM
ncbi:MAG: DUF3579 domain-containing protein [Gammaproteobacteria bacterium]|nr:DUF3579 domain-containing protein [Gammaproteobacteria bacterium]